MSTRRAKKTPGTASSPPASTLLVEEDGRSARRQLTSRKSHLSRFLSGPKHWTASTWVLVLLMPLLILRSGLSGWQAVPTVHLSSFMSADESGMRAPGGVSSFYDLFSSPFSDSGSDSGESGGGGVGVGVGVGGEEGEGEGDVADDSSGHISGIDKDIVYDDLSSWRMATDEDKKKYANVKRGSRENIGVEPRRVGDKNSSPTSRGWMDDLHFAKSSMDCKSVTSKDGYRNTMCLFENVVLKDGATITMYGQDIPANQRQVGAFGHWGGWKTIGIDVQQVSAPLRIDDCTSVIIVPAFFFAHQFWNVDYWHSFQMIVNLYQTIVEYSESHKGLPMSPTASGFGGLLDKNNHLCAQYIDRSHRHFNTIRDYFGLLGMLTQNPLMVQSYPNVCFRRAIVGFSPTLDFNLDPADAGLSLKKRQDHLDRFVRFFAQHVSAKPPPTKFERPHITVAYRKLPEDGSSDHKKLSFDKWSLQNLKMWASSWDIDLSMVVFEEMNHRSIIEHMGRTTVFVSIHGPAWANAAFMPKRSVGVMVQPTKTFPYFPSFFRRLVQTRGGTLLSWEVNCCDKEKKFVSVSKERFRSFLVRAFSLGVHTSMDKTWDLEKN